jgi:hypothetical protein
LTTTRAFHTHASGKRGLFSGCVAVTKPQTHRKKTTTMKKLIAIMSVTAFALTLPIGAGAAEKKDKAAAEKPAAEKPADAAKKPAEKPADAKPAEAKDPSRPLPYRGDVAAVDATAKTFTFKNKDGKERVFQVGADTKITKEDKPADFSAITVGAYATGSYKKGADGKLEVASVKIGPKPEKKPAAEGDAKPAEKKPEAAKPAEKKPAEKKP